MGNGEKKSRRSFPSGALNQSIMKYIYVMEKSPDGSYFA